MLRRLALFMTLAMVLYANSVAAQVPQPKPNESELERLLQLLAHPGMVNYVRVPKINGWTLSRDSKLWMTEIDKLRSSKVPEVVEAVRRLQPVFDAIRISQEAEKKTAEQNQELTRKYGPEWSDVGPVLSDAFTGPTQAEIERMVDNRQITRSAADRFLAQREAAQFNLVKKLGMRRPRRI